MDRRSLVPALCGAMLVVILVLLAVHLVAPQRSGIIALTQVMEQFIVLGALVLASPALLGRRRWRVAAVVLLVAFAALRHGPVLLSLPATGDGAASMRVATWNIEAGPNAGERVLDALSTLDADIVALEELQYAAADALVADPNVQARFPHRRLMPDSSVLGIGLLSRFPIVEHEHWREPPLLRAVLQPPDAEPVTVFVGHPLPARIRTVAGLPISLETSRRDADIALIRAEIDQALALGRPVIVLGDFNVTERDPAYAELRRGLRDAHLDAGLGPGLSWRLPVLGVTLPFGLLRIDYVLTSVDYGVASTSVDCSLPSDHCSVSATLLTL